jgi:hypothetical protein
MKQLAAAAVIAAFASAAPAQAQSRFHHCRYPADDGLQRGAPKVYGVYAYNSRCRIAVTAAFAARRFYIRDGQTSSSLVRKIHINRWGTLICAHDHSRKNGTLRLHFSCSPRHRALTVGFSFDTRYHGTFN